MPIHQNPANTRLATDLKIYRRKITNPSPNNPNSAQDIRGHLHKKDPSYPPNPPITGNNDILTSKAFRDLTSWQSGKNPKNQDTVEIPNRLGGGLDSTMPIEFKRKSATNPKGLPDPDPVQSPITWTPPTPQTTPPTPPHPPVTVEILPGGIVKHTDYSGPIPVEIHAAHHYMHGVFSNILYNLRELLEDINKALEAYAGVVSDTNPAAADAAVYSTAVDNFEKYCASLQPGGSSVYATTFNFVSINPVVTNEGFIVSCRVKMNWKNPYHSSSTIKVP